MRVVLASKSPRRSEILGGLGLKFEVITKDIVENSSFCEPHEYVMDIARQKGAAVAESINEKDALIISADTVVVLDNEIFGKPKSQEDAKAMLKKLQGRSHNVLTAVSLIYNGKTLTDYEKTAVCFGQMTDEDIAKYVATNEPMDRAGSYAVQGLASVYIDGIDGCYFNVVGFPTRLFYKMLKRLNIDIDDLR